MQKKLIIKKQLHNWKIFKKKLQKYLKIKVYQFYQFTVQF